MDPSFPVRLLLLADARLPAGGHAHSGGLEEAVAAGRVRGPEDLALWLEGRLATAGLVDAALAVAAHTMASEGMLADPAAGAQGAVAWRDLEAAWAARCPSPALRRASRAQGRGVLRAARACWPSPVLDALSVACSAGAPWPLALGAAARAAGCSGGEAALAAVHAAVAGPAWALTRLTGADPYAVASVLAALAVDMERVAGEALAAATSAVTLAADGAGAADAASTTGDDRPWRDLPGPTGPLLDLGAEAHATWEVRLFAS